MSGYGPAGPGPEHLRVDDDVREHGRRWSVCLDCGAQWTSDGDQIAEGDESCLDAAVAS